MNKFEKDQHGKTEKKLKLSELQHGEVFRLPNVSFEKALNKEDGALFYMKAKTQPEKTGRVTIVSLYDGVILERDDDHMVIRHEVKMLFSEAEEV